VLINRLKKDDKPITAKELYSNNLLQKINYLTSE